MANIYARLADFIQKYPKRIILAWVVVLLISLPIGIHAFDEGVMTYDMTGMVDSSYESVQGLEILGDDHYFPSGGMGVDVVVVVDVSESEMDKVNGLVNRMNVALADKYGLTPEGKPNAMAVGQQYLVKEGSTDGVAPVLVLFDPGYKVDMNDQIEPLRQLVRDCNTEGLTTYLTGGSAIAHDTEVGAMNDIKKIDPFTILLVLVLIGLFFRSIVCAATPPTVIGFAYGIVLTVIFGISQIMDVFYISGTIVLVAMLGAGCDYCIFILSRYREERKGGKDHHDALKEAITWAGESITTSGISVIIGFGAMSVCSFSMISTMGIILASGIVFALLAALTLIPSLIAVFGDRIFYPTKVDDLQPEGKVMQGWYGKVSRIGEKYFTSSANHSIKYAVPIVLAALLITLPLGYVAMTNEGSYDMISTMPDGEAKDGVDAISATGNGGMIMPTFILLEVDSAPGPLCEVSDIPDYIASLLPPSEILPDQMLTWTPRGTAYVLATMDLAKDMAEKDSNVNEVVPLYSFNVLVQGIMATQQVTIQQATAEVLKQPLFDMLDENMKNMIVLASGIETYRPAVFGIIDYMVNDTLSNMSQAFEGKQYIKMTMTVKDEPMSKASMDSIGTALDTVDVFESEHPNMFLETYITGSVAATYDIAKIVNDEFTMIELLVVILIFLLLFFVMKSYVTPLRAILTIVMSIIWTLGLTFIVFETILGVPVTFIMPIVLFVICLGLGMDYDILLTTRIKENVSKGMDNDTAIKEAIHKSGSVITICGIIMAGAFGTLMLSSSPMLQELGFGLAFAIAVDALVVRTYIVPAVMHLLGRWNWVGPACLQQEGGFKFTPKITKALGAVITGVILVCLIGAFVCADLPLANASMTALIDAGGNANHLMAVATMAGGVLLLLFGYAYSKTHADQLGTGVSALMVITGVLLALSTLVKVEGLNQDTLWIITGVAAYAAAAVSAYRQYRGDRPVAAGFIAMLLLAGALIAVTGAASAGFALITTGVFAMLVTAVSE